ncbi:MAG: hypothetical protein DWQ18_09460 [Crenarchaeota archaeon]|nr:MAG: hypothetical protein DWQ17_00325 [Thermoproteota archaeon]RDJ33354.1 MAG: hypothetical protein DWQ18_09460 [Thermoproteota archaeon]RDJ36142.1 MAG: hypothetical protein DWQ19_05860 [Thermoproteota archaeon]RDJ38774.1 MAG: hypothetical protein DWQ13_00325 [Thermoproteota archaeon]
MARNLGFRFWFYFRQGWSVYFAFIFAAINTLTVTYYLAIENYPILQQFFPTFESYILAVAGIGVPLLVAIGYAHYKRTSAFKAEATVSWESNPYARRMLSNAEMTLGLNITLLELILKLSNNEKLSEAEIKNILEKKKEIDEFLKSRSLDNKLDLDYMKKLVK